MACNGLVLFIAPYGPRCLGFNESPFVLAGQKYVCVSLSGDVRRIETTSFEFVYSHTLKLQDNEVVKDGAWKTFKLTGRSPNSVGHVWSLCLRNAYFLSVCGSVMGISYPRSLLRSRGVCVLSLFQSLKCLW